MLAREKKKGKDPGHPYLFPFRLGTLAVASLPQWAEKGKGGSCISGTAAVCCWRNLLSLFGAGGREKRKGKRADSLLII